MLVRLNRLPRDLSGEGSFALGSRLSLFLCLPFLFYQDAALFVRVCFLYVIRLLSAIDQGDYVL